MTTRIGHGYDVHKLVKGRALIIGGVDIPYEYGLHGHSDADVLIHAVCDALLGAAALRDIGYHFPDNDARFENIDSSLLLKQVYEMIKEKGYTVGNVDATVIAQKPRLSSYIPRMAENIASCLQTDTDNVNVKATTEEHLGFTGRCEGISAHAVCTLIKE